MSEATVDQLVAAIDRLGLVLGAVYAAQLGDIDQKTKAERLSRCGFTNAQIASLLGTTTNTIGVALHMARHRRSKSKRKQAKKK